MLVPMTIYISTAVEGDIAGLLGAPHYSYHFAARRFRDMLTRAGAAPVDLRMPEYYATRAALPPGDEGSAVHLMFRSTEQLRLLKPAANICCFAWEFPVLKTDTLPGEHPFANQHAMLSLCDEVWTPSAYACGVLRAHGIDNAHRIPAPVPLPQGGRIGRAAALSALGRLDAVTLNIHFAWPDDHQDRQAATTATTLGAWLAAHSRPKRKPLVFLSVLNPEDFRKNLDAMLRGFHHLRQQYGQALLIVKVLTARSRFSLAQAAGGVIRNKLAPGTVLRDDGIAIVNDYLSDTEMTALYSLADFYLCASLAEGQNLPLLEAMAHGTVAVTTRTTAMQDYITEANAFIIATRMVANDNVHLAATLARRPFAVAQCGARDVYAGLVAAAAASPALRAARARDGIETLRELYAENAIWPLLKARLQHYGHGREA
jgi:glycosyltransferase involved in cell wall biosynthesis